MIKELFLLSASLVLFSCTTQEGTSSQSTSSGDCRTVGMSCNPGFTCAVNITGGYECLPSQSSPNYGNSTQDNEEWSYNEETSSSSNTSDYSSEGDTICCYEGAGYVCSDSEKLNSCFRGEFHLCTFDPFIDCGEIRTEEPTEGPTEEPPVESNSCIEAGYECQSFGDCCDDSVCVYGFCHPFCDYDFECQSDCCAEIEIASSVRSVCAPSIACD